MKRTLYILLFALTVALMAACSKHTPTPIQPDTSTGSYIFFEPEIMESVETRASTVPFTGDKFGVFGYVGTKSIFTGYTNNIAEVKKEERLYVYDNLAQWQDATSTHNFYAFYPFDQTTGIADNVPYIPYTQPTTLAGMTDVMTATTSVSKQNLTNGLVTLNFTHRLWALDVKVKNSQTNDVVTNPDGSDVTITPNLYITGAKIHIYGYRKAGNLSMGDSKVFGADDKATIDEVLTFDLFTSSSENPTLQVDKGETKTFDPLLFLPANKTVEYRLEINFQNAWGASYDYYYPTPTQDGEGNIVYGYQKPDKYFLAGYRYSLEVEKIDAAGRFNINWAVQDWNKVDVEHTFN